MTPSEILKGLKARVRIFRRTTWAIHFLPLKPVPPTTRSAPSPKCLHDRGRIAWTSVDGSERHGAV